MGNYSEKIYEQELITEIDPNARFYVRDPVLGNRNIKGSALASALGVATVTTSISLTASKNTRYIVNTLANSVTITLPATPTVGTFIEVIDANGAFETHSVILARNGELISSLPEDLELDLNNITVGLTFVGNSVGWSVNVATIEPFGFASNSDIGIGTVATSTSLTAANNTRYLVNSLANSVTITLPVLPAIGSFIEVIDANSAFETHSVILDRNGQLINSIEDNLDLDLNNITVGLTFVGNSVGWSVSVSTIEPYTTPSTGITEVVTDATLTGNGTVLSPLALAGGPLENGARTKITYGTGDPTGVPVDGEIYIKRSA